MQNVHLVKNAPSSGILLSVAVLGDGVPLLTCGQMMSVFNNPDAWVHAFLSDAILNMINEAESRTSFNANEALSRNTDRPELDHEIVLTTCSRQLISTHLVFGGLARQQTVPEAIRAAIDSLMLAQELFQVTARGTTIVEADLNSEVTS